MASGKCGQEVRRRRGADRDVETDMRENRTQETEMRNGGRREKQSRRLERVEGDVIKEKQPAWPEGRREKEVAEEQTEGDREKAGPRAWQGPGLDPGSALGLQARTSTPCP